jgi:hypothetical protein
LLPLYWTPASLLVCPVCFLLGNGEFLEYFLAPLYDFYRIVSLFWSSHGIFLLIVS